MTTPRLTVAFPAYNEEAALTDVVGTAAAQLDELGLDWEILVIDNASTDRTHEIASRLAAADPRIRALHHETNRLYSGSCATAMREARGTYVAIVDSDGQADIRDVTGFLDQLDRGNNLVIGWRQDRHDGFGRAVMSKVFNLLGKLYLRYPHHDLNCGFRAFDRAFIEATKITHSVNMANPELYVRARIAGLEVGETPVRHYPRAQGEPSHDFKRLGRIFRGTNSYLLSLRRELKQARRSA